MSEAIKHEAIAFAEGVKPILEIMPTVIHNRFCYIVHIRGEADNQKVHQHRVSEALGPSEIKVAKWLATRAKRTERHPIASASASSNPIELRDVTRASPRVAHYRVPTETSRLISQEYSTSSDNQCCIIL